MTIIRSALPSPSKSPSRKRALSKHNLSPAQLGAVARASNGTAALYHSAGGAARSQRRDVDIESRTVVLPLHVDGGCVARSRHVGIHGGREPQIVGLNVRGVVAQR